jgi:hypothetical protein
MIRVIRVIRVLLMRSSLRTPIAEPYTQLITDLERGTYSIGRELKQAVLIRIDEFLYLARRRLRVKGARAIRYGERKRNGIKFNPESARYLFCHKSEDALRPGGTLDISRWWNHRKVRIKSPAPRMGRRT